MDAERRRAIRKFTVVSIVAVCWGLAVWWATMASAPRFSLHGETGSHGGLVAGLLAGAVLAGTVACIGRQPTDASVAYLSALGAFVAGCCVALPGLVLSPWTTPRGDNDGLWVLMIVYMAFAVVCAGIIAALFALVGTAAVRSSRTRSKTHGG